MWMYVFMRSMSITPNRDIPNTVDNQMCMALSWLWPISTTEWDIYSIPSLNLVQTFLFSIKVNALYKVCIASNGWVVAGGENGCPRLYDMQRGELLQMI